MEIYDSPNKKKLIPTPPEKEKNPDKYDRKQNLFVSTFSLEMDDEIEKLKQEKKHPIIHIEELKKIDFNENPKTFFVDVPAKKDKKIIFCSICNQNITNEIQFRCIDCCDIDFFVCFECLSYTNMNEHNPEHKIVAFNKLPEEEITVKCNFESKGDYNTRNRIFNTFEPFIKLVDYHTDSNTYDSCDSSLTDSEFPISKKISSKNNKITLLRNNIEINRNHNDILKKYEKKMHEDIFFDNCELSTITDNIKKFLHMNGNLINELSFERNSIRNFSFNMIDLKKLKILNLSHNNISHLTADFLDLISLEKLYLSYNNFSEIPHIIFDLVNIQNVYLDGNDKISNWLVVNILKKKHLHIHIDNKPSLVELWNTFYLDVKNITIEWNNVYPTHIINGLYIGSIKSALNEYVYKHCGIETVFSIGKELNPMVFKSMKNIKISVDDDISENIPFEYLNLLHDNLNKNNCLVHCFMGISRSPSFVIAFLMKYYNLRLNDAYSLVKSKRDIVFPNSGFWKQLIKLDKELFGDDNIEYKR